MLLFWPGFLESRLIYPPISVKSTINFLFLGQLIVGQKGVSENEIIPRLTNPGLVVNKKWFNEFFDRLLPKKYSVKNWRGLRGR